MEAFGGTGYFSAGLPAPETRKGKLVSDRCHGEGADKGRVMSSLHVSRVASRWTVACAVSWPSAVGSRLQQPTVGSEQNTHRTRVQVRCRAQGTGQGGLGEWIACVDVRAERQRGEGKAGFASFTTQHTALGTGWRLLVADQQEPCAPVSWGWRWRGARARYCIETVESRRGEWRRSGEERRESCTAQKVGGGHAATMEFRCFKRQVGGGQLKRYARNDATPAGNCGLGWGRRRLFFLPSSLVAKSGLSPMRI